MSWGFFLAIFVPFFFFFPFAIPNWQFRNCSYVYNEIRNFDVNSNGIKADKFQGFFDDQRKFLFMAQKL
jgi:hypothetical protein